jgi:hypothetical protein
MHESVPKHSALASCPHQSLQSGNVYILSTSERDHVVIIPRESVVCTLASLCGRWTGTKTASRIVHVIKCKVEIT